MGGEGLGGGLRFLVGAGLGDGAGSGSFSPELAKITSGFKSDLSASRSDIVPLRCSKRGIKGCVEQNIGKLFTR